MDDALPRNSIEAAAISKAREAWSIGIDNDILAPGGKDQDYTFGVNLSYSGNRLEGSILDSTHDTIDHLLRFSDQDSKGNRFELGFYAFAPAQPKSGFSIQDDRPYASLIYASSTNERVNFLEKTVLRTQLTIGVLGLDIVGDIQNGVHRAIGNEEEQGWSEQISSGGEPTIRYQVAKQRLLATTNNFEWKSTRSISLGYITEASWALSLRGGKIRSSWHDFSPEVVNYAENQIKRQGQIKESFFWAGAAVKLRGYNGFLQGQFRDSKITLGADDINHLLLEAWAGYTHSFGGGYFVSYSARGHSSEVKSGPANRTVIWGGLTLGKLW